MNAKDFGIRPFAPVGWVNVTLFLTVLGMAVLAAGSPAAAVVLAAGLALGAAALGRIDDLPRLGLFIIVAAIPFDTVTRTMWNPMTTLPKVVFVPAFAVFVAAVVMRRRPMRFSRHVWTAVAFIGTVLLSALLTDGDPAAKTRVVGMAVGVVLLLVLAVNVFERERDVESLLWIVAVSNTLAAGVSLMIGGGFAGSAARDRLLDTMIGDAPSTAMAAMIGLCAVRYAWTTATRTTTRLVLIGAAAILFLTLLHSKSRVGVICLMAFAAHAAIFQRSAFSFRQTILPVALAALLATPFLPSGMERLAVLLKPAALSTDTTFEVRIDTVKAGLSMLGGSIVWGVGPGQFTARYASEDFRFITEFARRNYNVHNTYAWAAAELGLLGLGALLLLVTMCVCDLWFAGRRLAPLGEPVRGPPAQDNNTRDEMKSRLRRQAATVGSLLLMELVAGLSMPRLYNKYLWLTFALTAVLYRLSLEALETGAAGSGSIRTNTPTSTTSPPLRASAPPRLDPGIHPAPCDKRFAEGCR